MTQNFPKPIQVTRIPQTAPDRPPTGPTGARTPRSSFTGCPRCGALMADRAAHEAWHAEQDARMEKLLAAFAQWLPWAERVAEELSRPAHFPTAGNGATDGDITNDGKEAGHE